MTISDSGDSPNPLAFLDDLMQDGSRRRLKQMRSRYEAKSDKAFVNLLDRVRSDAEDGTTQRWLRCRLHWFGNTEFKRDEMEKALHKVLVDSKRVTEELRKPTGMAEYEAIHYLTGDSLAEYLPAEFETAANSVAAFSQPLTLATDAQPYLCLEEDSFAAQDTSGSLEPEFALLPETSMLFDARYAKAVSAEVSSASTTPFFDPTLLDASSLDCSPEHGTAQLPAVIPAEIGGQNAAVESLS